MKPRYLFPSDYMADPAAKVFNGKLYIYPSHDRECDNVFDDDGGHFQMRDYHVLSFDDVEKYYLVFSAKDYNGEFHLGVAIADKPEGPFIPQEHPIRGAYSIDPCVFKDDDGTVYCYYGGLWGGQLQWHVPLSVNPVMQPDTDPAPAGYVDLGHASDKKTELWAPADAPALTSFVARMTDDVLQFTEAPRPVVIVDKDGKPLKASDPHRFFEASWMHKYNGKYYFSYSTGDSHFLCYAIGDTPYGPFTY